MNILQYIDALSKIEAIQRMDNQLAQEVLDFLQAEWAKVAEKAARDAEVEARMKAMGLK